VELILEIRRLLFDEGLTIAGARKKISALEEKGEKPKAKPPKEDEEPTEAKAEEKPKPPKTSSARRKAPKKAEGKVDKETPADVQPLLATLKNVRDEVEKIIDDLKGE
jgi:hypothetical protein